MVEGHSQLPGLVAFMDDCCVNNTIIDNLFDFIRDVFVALRSNKVIIFDDTEVRCPALPTWEGMLHNSTGRGHMDEANISCHTGYKFGVRDTDISSVHLTCQQSGYWIPSVPECICTSINLYINLTLFVAFYLLSALHS